MMPVCGRLSAGSARRRIHWLTPAGSIGLKLLELPCPASFFRRSGDRQVVTLRVSGGSSASFSTDYRRALRFFAVFGAVVAWRAWKHGPTVWVMVVAIVYAVMMAAFGFGAFRRRAARALTLIEMTDRRQKTVQPFRAKNRATPAACQWKR